MFPEHGQPESFWLLTQAFPRGNALLEGLEGPGGRASYNCLQEHKTGERGSQKEQRNETKSSLPVRLQQKVFLHNQGVLFPAGHPCWVYPPRRTEKHISNLQTTRRLYHPHVHSLVKQPPGRAWTALATFARDRQHLPACSFTQWHKRMKTALQEHSLPSFFCFIS